MVVTSYMLLYNVPLHILILLSLLLEILGLLEVLGVLKVLKVFGLLELLGLLEVLWLLKDLLSPIQKSAVSVYNSCDSIRNNNL